PPSSGGGRGCRGAPRGRAAIQLPDQLLEQLRELAGHHRKVEIELLGGVDLLLVALLRRDFEEFDSLDLQLLGQHERDATIPGEPQLRGTLAACDIRTDLLAVERVPAIADDGFCRLTRLQLEVLLD